MEIIEGLKKGRGQEEAKRNSKEKMVEIESRGR
jgi:hypothetical protein